MQPPPAAKATVIVTVDPDSIQEVWTLSGPADFFLLGRGTSTLPDLQAGTYSIHWASPPCWSLSASADSVATATAGDTTVFYQAYAAQPQACGKLVINILFADEQFASLSVPWTLSGPDDFSLTGQGTAYLDMIPPGEYRIQWAPPEGFRFLTQTPTATVSTGETGILSATIEADLSQHGRIEVINYPLGLNAFWEITGPGNPITGWGNQAIDYLVPGDYHISWAEVPEFSLVPETEFDLHMGPHQIITFTGEYRRQVPASVKGIQVRPGDGPGLVDVSWQWVQDSLYPVTTYEIRTSPDGPLTDANWNQARRLSEQAAVANQESYTRTFSVAEDGMVPGVMNWFGVRAWDGAGQPSPLEGQWGTVPTQTGAVTGRVIAADGQLQAGVPVELSREGKPPLRTTTDIDGAFAFSAILNNLPISLRTVSGETDPGRWFDYTLELPVGSPLEDLPLPLVEQHEMDSRCTLATPDFMTYLRAMTKTNLPTDNRPDTKLYKWDHWPLTVYLPADDTPVEVDFQAQSRWALEIWNTTMPEPYFVETDAPETADVVFVYSDQYPTLNGQVSILEPRGGYVVGNIIPQRMEVYLHSTMDSAQRVAEVALHELGHVIGIAGHSPCSRAGYLMYITSAGVLDNGPENAIHPDEQALVEAIRHLPQGLDMAGFNPD